MHLAARIVQRPAQPYGAMRFTGTRRAVYVHAHKLIALPFVYELAGYL